MMNHKGRLIVRSMRSSFIANRSLFVIYIATSLIAAGFVILEAVLPESFINILYKYTETSSTKEVYRYGGGFLLFAVFYGLSNGINNLISSMQRKMIYKYNKSVLCKKEKKVELYEDSLFLDNVEKADEGADAASYIPLILLSLCSFYAPALLGLSVYYFRISPYILICVGLGSIPNIFAEKRKEQLYDKFFSRIANKKRIMDEFSRSIFSKETFKENVHLNLFDTLYEKWSGALENYLEEKYSAQKKSLLIDACSKICLCIGNALLVLLMTFLLLEKKITVGEFAAIFASFSSFSFLVDEMVNKNFMVIAEHAGAINNYFGFIDTNKIEDEKRGSVLYSVESEEDLIDLKDVAFKYPHAEKYALNRINLKIKKGEYIAIVGENGSGKTTLSKILLGLYDPSEGTIRRAEDIKKSAVFQNYVRYNMSLTDNICISDIEEEKDISSILSMVRFEIEDLDIMLGREYGGSELSGGQWQKVAVARGIYRKNDIMIMDEPTAAIDPLREDELYQLFDEIATKTTLLIITHRLGCTKNVGKVIVMDQGEICEVGTPSELLLKNGKYAEMYRQQQQWYT